jgi:RNA polymerase sigma-70 factor (ECF subfamily)
MHIIMKACNTATNPVSAALSGPKARERMVHLSLSILRDRSDAEDAAHDAVKMALRKSNSFRAESLVTTWLHRVTVNAALMKLRSRRRAATHVAVSERAGHEDVCDFPGDPSSTPVARFEDQEVRFRLRAAVARLPRTYQDVIQLCIFEERELPEVAHSLGITQQAVRTRMCRARAQLRENLAA